MGPLTMTRGEQGCVVVWIACRLNAGSATASTAARITGRCSGSAPAITAFAAMTSTLARPRRGTRMAAMSSGRRGVPESMRATRSRVGGMAGSPSPHPCSMSHVWNSSISPGASIDGGTPPAAVPLAPGLSVRARSTLSTMASALAVTAAGGMPPMGWGTVTTGSPGRPLALTWAWASGMNSSVPSTTQATPLASSSAASWTLHDVHEPQSAEAVRATRAAEAISSRTTTEAPIDDPGLPQARTARAPPRAARSSPTRSRSTLAFGLELSRSAMVTPWREAGRGARVLAAAALELAGSTMSMSGHHDGPPTQARLSGKGAAHQGQGLAGRARDESRRKAAAHVEYLAHEDGNEQASHEAERVYRSRRRADRSAAGKRS